jgi:phosphoglycolate phosphatase-like HAD superfamily hydrolase
MIGDADTDVVAGIAAGTSTALIEHPLTAHRRSDPHARPDVRISSLDQFVEWLLAGRSAEAVPARSRFGA